MVASLEILSVSLFQMDIEKNVKKHIPVEVNESDLSDVGTALSRRSRCRIQYCKIRPEFDC